MGLTLQLTLLALLVFIHHHRVECSDEVIGLNGRGWISYDISKEETDRDKVTVSFRTMEPNGMLMYSCGRSSNDFLLIEMKRGRLV